MKKRVVEDIQMVFATVWHNDLYVYEQDKKELSKLMSCYGNITPVEIRRIYSWFNMCWKNKLWIYKKPKDRKNIRRY